MVLLKLPVAHKSPFQKWKETIDASKSDPKWDQYDGAIKKTVSEYNRHLASTPGYYPLDWRLIKAMIWTETGADSKVWDSRPIQIGNAGDPGMATVLAGREGSALVIPPSIKGGLFASKIKHNPVTNIQAGVGYLLTKCAHYGSATVVNPNDNKDYDYTVKHNDNLSEIAHECGTTIDILRKMNNGTSTLKQGTVLHYKKASTQVVITGWYYITTSLIANKYNGHGDPKYREKLDYCLTKIKLPPCWKEICH